MMAERTVVLSPVDASCAIGNLFACLEPPCDDVPEDRITLCGSTFSGAEGRMTIRPVDGSYVCQFTGSMEDLNAALEKPCLEKRCGHA